MRVQRFVTVLLAVVLAVLVSGCVRTDSTGRFNLMSDVQDAAGFTQAEVAEMSIEEQYELLGARYERLMEFLTAAQLVISDQEWEWSGGYLAQNRPNGGPDRLHGSTFDNSYYFDVSRIIDLPGASGDLADLEPMREHFVAQGWEPNLTDFGDGSYRLWADTGEGYRIGYFIQPNGRYNITIYGGTYWADYHNNLGWEVKNRMPDGPFPRQTVPGVVHLLPDWSVPYSEDAFWPEDMLDGETRVNP